MDHLFRTSYIQNSELTKTKKYSEFEMHEKNKKEWSQQMQNKNTKLFSSLVTFIRYAMVLSFF